MFSRWKGDGVSCSQRMPSPNDSPFSYVVGSKQTMHSISTPKVSFSGFGMLADWLVDARWDLENAKGEGRENWAPFPAFGRFSISGTTSSVSEGQRCAHGFINDKGHGLEQV